MVTEYGVLVRSTFKTVFIVASFLFMGLSAWKLMKQVGRFPDSPDLPLLLTSVILVWCGFISAIFVWRSLLSSYGEYVPFPDAYRIYFQANLGKYLPGKIWQLAGTVLLCGELGIGAGKSLAATLYNSAAAILTGLAILFAVLPGKVGGAGNELVWYLVTALGLFLFVAFPGALTFGVNRALRMLGKEEIKERISRRDLVGSLIGYLFSWCVFGLSFHILMRFLGLGEGLSFLETTGIFSGSVSIGFLAFFSPGGIGVREGIMVLLLKETYPVSTAVFVSLVTRLWITAVELLGFLSTYLIPRSRVRAPKEGTDERTIA
jgi:hypothetical protein